MIVECVRCGDPLLPDMEHCRCGGANPSFVTPKDPFWDSDLGIEAGLFCTAVYGLLVGLGAALTASSVGARILGTFCALLGGTAMFAFHRIHVIGLPRAVKWMLRIAVFALLIVFTIIRAALRHA